MPKGFVYLLLSQKDNRTYLGSTDDLERRIKEHNSGKVTSTRYRRPLKLIYEEVYDTLDKARRQERYLKSRSGRRNLKELFNKYVGV